MQESYEPTKYWTERGKDYISSFYEKKEHNIKIDRQERLLMQYLVPLSTVCSGRILEVGAGFGRISKLVLERFHQRIEEYILLDISREQLYNARIYLANNLESSIMESVNVKFIQCDFLEMDFVNADKFDLVLAVEVLMHVLPVDIQKAVDALVSLSQKNVISVDWYDDEPDKVPKKVEPHNTIHNYPLLYRNCEDVETVIRIPLRDVEKGKDVPEQSLFHVIKKRQS